MALKEHEKFKDKFNNIYAEPVHKKLQKWQREIMEREKMWKCNGLID